MPQQGEVAFAWDLKAGDPKYARLSERLFGKRRVMTLKDGRKKEYLYDGILMAWANGKRIEACHHHILGNSLFSIPDMMVKEGYKEKLLAVFKELDIPVRVLHLTTNELMTWGKVVIERRVI